MTGIFMQRHFGSLRPAEPRAEEILSKIKNGAFVRVEIKRVRSVQHMRLFFAIMNLVHENLPERYANVYPKMENMLDAVKIALGHFEPIISLQGEVVGQKPSSISFERLGQDEWNDFFNRSMDLLLNHFLPEVGKDALIAEVTHMLADKRYADDRDAA
jgi:hypothetical protein